MRGLKIKLIKPGELVGHKMGLLKSIMDFSGLGLRDSKDFLDNLYKNIGIYYQLKSKSDNYSEFEKFQNRIEQLDIDIQIIGDKDWNRNVKLLTLNLGNKSDYLNFISDEICMLPFDNIKKIFATLSEDSLKDIFNSITKNYNNIL